MESEIKLNTEKWDLKLDDEIKYITSLEKNFTYILTESFFCIYDKSKENLTKYPIPESIFLNLEPRKNENYVNDKIWPDKLGNHIIFKLDGICYYYNSIFKEKKKIKPLKLFSEEKEYIEPLALSFNDINKNPKNSDDIIFTDFNSIIYSLNIKAEENGEVVEKLVKIFDLKNIKNINIDNNLGDKEKIEENKETDELDKYLEDSFFIMEKDDKIYDIKMFIKEEKVLVGKKTQIVRNYFILAISKRIIFQFKGKNSINEIFSQYKKDDNTINIKKLIKNCKIFPKVNKSPLENPRLQIYKSKNKKQSFFSWNNEVGFTFWEITSKKSEDKNDNNIQKFPLVQKDFNLYRYIRIKSDGNFDKNPCPLACISSSRCIYFLYNDCLMVINTLTNNIFHIQYFKDEKEKYFDMFYHPEMNKILIYSSNKIIKLSLEHEFNNLWKDYIQKGDYDLAIQVYPKEDENFKSQLRKLKANSLFDKKEYESAGLEYALSDENFEHVCMKFLKLNDNTHLFNYLNFVNKISLSKIEEREKNKENKEIFLIQKYLINTWLLELIFEKIDDNVNNDEKIKNKNLREIINESGYIDSKNYLDKLIIFYSLRNYGRREDFVEFAGLKNDYKAIIFDLVNHNKFKEAIQNLILFLSYGDDDNYLKKLIKIFKMYINIFVKESPKQVLELLDEYYFLIEDPKQIIRILINLDDIYKNKMDEDTFESALNFIKKLIDITKKNKKGDQSKLNLDDSFKQNLYNLYILYLSKSFKLQHDKELNNYLKSLITQMNRPTNKYSFNKNNNKNKIYFEFSFAENLFKNKKSALALLYCLKKQYNKSISYACKCADKNISIFIANSITDPKKKKEIWLSLFNNYKSNGMSIIGEILQKSNGVLTITDILPHLMGNVQLKDIETNLNKYIDEYEVKLRKLKLNIKDFAKSEEILDKKISRVNDYGRKYFKIKFQEINCSVCLKNLKEDNFFLFPCKHAFDLDCIINLLLYFDNKKIGDENFKQKIKSIKGLLDILEKSQELKNAINPSDKKSSLNNLAKLKNQNNLKGLQRSFTDKNYINNLDLDEENKILNSTINELDELLNEECPLCGNELILGTQTKFGDEDNNEWSV